MGTVIIMGILVIYGVTGMLKIIAGFLNGGNHIPSEYEKGRINLQERIERGEFGEEIKETYKR